jgi:signal transduction histidine kinase
VSGRSAKVLIVDDRIENLIAMEAVLRPLPADLVRARSGNEALARLLRDEYALVLLDVQMPDMDGFEVATLMRSNERTRHVPIVFVTALGAEKRHVLRGYESGAVDFLWKPVDPVILKSKVEVFLRLHRQGRALAVLAELRRTQAALEWANADLEAFLQAVYHDLREPVRASSITVDQLLERLDAGLDPETRLDLEMLRQRTFRIASLLDGLAEYARVDATGSDWTAVDLAETLDLVTVELADAIEAAAARLEAGVLPVVQGIPSQLATLLHHLIANALKFRREDVPLAIRVEAEALSADATRDEGLDPEQAHVALTVRDNGIGLRAGEADRLFGALIHLHSRERFEGSHLGLAVCRRIVERHHGAIRADSKPGEGLAVRVVLPVDAPKS